MRIRPRRSGPAAVAVACALVASGCQAPASDGRSRTPDVPTVVATTVASPSVATTGTPTPTAAGTRSTLPTSVLPAPELSRIELPDLGFDAPVIALTTDQMGGAIDPPKYVQGRPSGPVWVADKGVRPTATASDTTYVGCHTSVSHGPEQYPCDVLVRAVKPGQRVVVTTASGPLTYTVTKTRSIPYGAFASDVETWRVQAKRLVFVVCDILDGSPTHANYVIYATLT